MPGRLLRECLSRRSGVALGGGAGAVREEPGGGRLLFRVAADRGIPGALVVAAADGTDGRTVRPLPAAAPVHALWLGRDAIACCLPAARPAATHVLAPDGRELARVRGHVCAFDAASGRGLLCDAGHAVLNLWEPRRGTVDALAHVEELAARLPAGARPAGAVRVLADARWSGDGRRLFAVLAARPARRDATQDLFVLETGGAGCRHLGAIAGDAQWTADGATIVARVPRGAATDLVAWPAGGGAARVLWPDFPGLAVSLDPARARAVAAVPSGRGGAPAVVLFDFARRTHRTLAVGARAVAPDPCWSADGGRIFAHLAVGGRARLCALQRF